MNAQSRGFTLVELLVVIALVAIILALAAPSFTSTLARKRLEGVASELATDLHYARSEAMQRNASVGVVFGTNCYVIYTPAPGEFPASGCTALGGPPGLPPIVLKSVAIEGGNSLNFVPAVARVFPSYVAFDPVTGMAVGGLSGTEDVSGYIDASNGAGNWRIRALITKIGRVKQCSPNNTITGLATDCL